MLLAPTRASRILLWPQCARMVLEQLADRLQPLLARHVGETHDACEWHPIDEYQLAEVLVLGDQHPLLPGGSREHDIVGRAGSYLRCGDDIMTLLGQHCAEVARVGARVDEELHAPQ